MFNRKLVTDIVPEMNDASADFDDGQPTELGLHQTNWIPYPTGFIRFVARFPLLIYRLGLGDLLNSLHLMVLTTRGRKSGQPRHTPIEYRQHGRKIYLVSAWGKRPNWYQNVLVDPLVTVQLGGKTVAARAYQVQDRAEALRALSLFRRIAPARYDAVLGRLIEADVSAWTLPDQSAQFTILRLDVVTEAPRLPGLPANLAWLLPLALFTIFSAATLLAVMRLRRAAQGDL